MFRRWYRAVLTSYSTAINDINYCELFWFRRWYGMIFPHLSYISTMVSSSIAVIELTTYQIFDSMVDALCTRPRRRTLRTVPITNNVAMLVLGLGLWLANIRNALVHY